MKISAIDIRKHTFDKIFRGYDPDAVDAFLNSLSQEWERYTSENRQLKAQLEHTEKELSKLKDIESSLFRTLKTAEETGRQIEKEANEVANQKIELSKTQAEEMVSEAEQRTQQVIQDTEVRLQQLKEDFLLEVKNQERDFKAIENYRDNLIVQLSSLANSTMETVERFEQKYDKETVLNKLEEIKTHVDLVAIPPKTEVAVSEPEELPETDHSDVIDDQAVSLEKAASQQEILVDIAEEDDSESFFVDSTEPLQETEPDQPLAVAKIEPTTPVNSERSDEATPEPNKFKNPEPTPTKVQGGGSFFDQI